jgi:hypothetical protein
VDALPQVASWPAVQTLSRVALALAVGFFVGLEREWRGKKAGVRTFGFPALLGALGGLLGTLQGPSGTELPSATGRH